MRYITKVVSPLGKLTLASDGESLTGLWLDGQKYYAAGLCANAEANDALPVFAQAKAWLESYFAGKKPSPAALPLAPIGSDFRQAVWKLLLEIPYGACTTYGALAAQLAAQGKNGMSAQAVGGAVGHNPISIIIPCHRVVGANNSLTGYAGGLDAKIRLLTLEGAPVADFTVPKKGTAL